jgi:exodeoxyribonuclease-3
VFDGAAQFSKPLTGYSFYVPAGGDEPDPSVNGKFAHKLAFLDLNVAPLEHDAWSHKHLLKWTRPSDHVPVLATFEL